MREHLEPFRVHLVGRGSAPRTVATYVDIAATFATAVDGIDTPTTDDVVRFLARKRVHGMPASPATKNQEIAALRAFFAFLRRTLNLPDPTESIDFVREPPRDATVLTLDEVRRLFRVAAATSSPRLRTRDLAILGLLAQTGFRVHELVALNVDQVDLASATLLEVRGKGGSVHNVPLSSAALVLVGAWLGERSSIAQEDEPALLVSHRGRRLGVRAVQLLLVRLREGMGTKKRVTPHTLRHTTTATTAIRNDSQATRRSATASTTIATASWTTSTRPSSRPTRTTAGSARTHAAVH